MLKLAKLCLVQPVYLYILSIAYLHAPWVVKLVLALHQIIQNLSLTNPAILRHLPVTSLTAGMVLPHKVCLAQVTGAIFAPEYQYII